MTEEKGEFRLATPPDKVFLFKRDQVADIDDHISQRKPAKMLSSQDEQVPLLDNSKGENGVSYPKEGGQYIWHIARPFPRKGHVYPQALRDLFWPKRILINFVEAIASKPMIPFFITFGILPKKFKGKIIDTLLSAYIDTVDGILEPHYIQPRYYIDICRALAQPIITFLMELGVSKPVADRFALIFVTIIEYDSAYRLRLEDLLTETTKEKMLADPVGEAKRLVEILAERDDREHLVKKFEKFATLLKYGFFFVRKPFRKALEPVTFKLLQFDDIDRYLVQHWLGYDFFGMTIEERVKKWPPKDYPAYQVTSN